MAKKDPLTGGDMLTADEVMDRLLAEPSLRRKAVTCVLPMFKLDGEWCVRRGHLEDWIVRERRGNRVQPRPS